MAMNFTAVHFNQAEAIGRRQLDLVGRSLNRSLERLATGKNINRASDDPSGLTAVDSFKAQQQRIEAKIKGLDRESTRYGALDGGLSAASEVVLGLKTLVVASANTGGLSREEQAANQLEIDSVVKTITHLAQTSVFNGELILQGYVGAQAGSISILERDASGNPVGSSELRISAALASLASGGANDLSSGNFAKAAAIADAIVDHVSTNQAAVGLEMRRIDTERRRLLIENENIAAARSQIEDTDYAAETSNLVRNQVLQEAATFAITLARDLQAQTVLDLIKSQKDLIESAIDRS